MNTKRNFLMVLVLLATLAGASAGLALARNPADNNWSALDNVPRFLKETEDAGFSWQEGSFSFMDLIKEACAGQYPSAMGNNPWPNAYFTIQMPNPRGC